MARGESEGHGATFEEQTSVREIRAADDHGAPANAAAPFRSAVSRSWKRLEGITVLAIDDQEDSRDLVATVLEDAGAIVTQADSAETAIQALRLHEFAVVVSDIGMPGEDGYGLVRRIRTGDAQTRSRSVPALALTAYASPDDRRRALEAGFQEHAAKPIEPSKLVDIVSGLARR